jgi:tetratricopeptide (TPR) repeat protein
MAGEAPAGRGGRLAPPAGFVRTAAPVVVFALLCVWFGSTLPGGGEAPWLDRAAEVARRWSAQGTSPLRLLAPAEDPRVAPGALLLRLGLAPSALGALARIVGFGVGAAAIALLARRRREGAATVSAWLLAVSPLWVEACVRGEPAVALGLIFAAFGAGALGAAGVALLLGWALGWSPWSWVTLLVIPAGWLLIPARRARAAAILAASLVLALLLDPPAALHPAGWLSGLRWQGRLDGLASAFAPFGTMRGVWPALGALHLPALAFLVVAARRWPGRVRRGDFAPIGFLAAVGLGLPGGLSHAAPLLIALPWAAGEAGSAVESLAARARPGAIRLGLRRVVPVLLLVPLLALAATRWARHAPPLEDPRREAATWIEANLAPASPLACDPDFSPPDSSRMVWVPLPVHSTDPRIYRGAYWPGWFAAFRGFVVSERLMARYLRAPEASGPALGFHLWLMRAATADRVFGSTPGRRLHLLEMPAGRGPALGDGWKERVRAGEAGGLPGGFVASLGGALIRAGRAGDGTGLLQEALAAGYRDKGIYLNLANGRLAADQPNEAGQVLEEAMKLYPDEPDLLYNFGLVLLRNEYWDRAIMVLGRLRRLWPRSADAAYLLGLALAHSSHSAAAPSVLREALDLGLRGPRRQACLDELATLGGAPQ